MASKREQELRAAKIARREQGAPPVSRYAAKGGGYRYDIAHGPTPRGRVLEGQ